MRGGGAAASAFEDRVPTAASLQFKGTRLPRGPRKVIGLIFEGILHFAGWSSGRNPTPNSLPTHKRMGLDKDLRRRA
ncbi:MAG: hypothetical protein K0S39_6118 [Paenibacillus sp.]|nr:hypothetical protein [Paenibacillus sp.]